MKTTPFLLLLFIALSSTISLSSAAASPDPVLDITGKNLRSGINYNVLPVFRGRGGGLTLASTGNESCAVVQERHEVDSGLALTFTPVNPKKGVVRVSTDLNIKFTNAATTVCKKSTVWRLKYDEAIIQYFVTGGGVEGNPGRTTIDNWFKIEKFDNDYKFLFCPTVCNYCKVICRDVGIFYENGVRRLALSDVPFKVMFKKA